jgi:hypothetical protein
MVVEHPGTRRGLTSQEPLPFAERPLQEQVAGPPFGWLEQALVGLLMVAIVAHPLLRGSRGPWLFTWQDVLVVSDAGALVLSPALLWLIWLAWRRQWPAWSRTATLPIVLWLVWQFISAALAPSLQNLAFYFAAHALTGPLLAWMIFDVGVRRERWRTLAKAFAGAGILVGLVGLAELVNLPVIKEWLLSIRVDYRFGDVIRLSSVAIYPTITSMMLELTTLSSIAWLLETKKPWLRLFLAVGAASQLLTLVLTLSRGAILGMLAAAVLVMAVAARSRQRAVLKAGGLVAIGLAALSLGSMVKAPALVYRLVGERDQQLWSDQRCQTAYGRRAPALSGRLDARTRRSASGRYDYPAGTGTRPADYRRLSN